MKVRVLKAWTASYENPLRLAKGDRLMLTGKKEDWDGHIWVWARSMAGREGWIPETLTLPSEDKFHASRDYTAQELTCTEGDILNVTDQTHGWSFCQSDDRREGWVPNDHLADLQDDE